MSSSKQNNNLDTVQPTIGFDTAILVLLGAIIGAIVAITLLPTWLPGLSTSLLGAEPRAYWYLARASGVVAYVLLWLSVALGIAIKNKLAQAWPGGPTAVDLHQFTSLFALALAIFHALILLGDRYASYSITQIMIPFTLPNQSLWVGLGQTAFYLMLPVAFSFYVRRWIGFQLWRVIHYFSFIIYFFVTAHGLWAGSDTSTPALLGLYGFTVFATYFLTVHRILVSVRQPRQQTG